MPTGAASSSSHLGGGGLCSPGAASSSHLGGSGLCCPGAPGEALAGVLLEQSPAARSSKAPSDPPSEFSSWHDDASSSLATFSAGDRTITVNTQRARMGEHLRDKLNGMIRQRFEDYLRIAQTLQNETGKLAALECELRMPQSAGASQARTSVSCNEDGTFFVYTVPDFSTLPRSPTSSSFGSQAGEAPDSLPAEARKEDGSEGPLALQEDIARVGQPDAVATSGHTGVAASTGAAAPRDGSELLRLWVKQVCEFGMSGCCHSLTALFDFGYSAWKQLLQDSPTNDPWAVRPRDQELSRGHIAEEEERPMREEEPPQAPPQPPPEEPPAKEVPAEDSPSSAAAAPREQRTLAEIMQDAKLAIDCERYQQALELCTEGITRAQAAAALSSAASSSSALPWGHTGISSSQAPAGGSAAASCTMLDAEDAPVSVWQLLSMRASVQARLRSYNEALRDAEELIALQPTCAEGYYWQSTAFWGKGWKQEALESLMSALEYEPQNPLFQQAFTSLFEEISGASAPVTQAHSSRSGSDSTAAAAAHAPAVPPAGAAAAPVLQARRPRGRPAGDALSTTTQATRLSSRSTTPTEVSAPLSHSSSNDSLSMAGAAFDEAT